MGYNGNIAPLDTLGTWEHFRGKRVHDECLLAFGWGDGAGGPSERMLENYSRIAEFPALPRLRMGTVDGFFARLPREGLPRWVGELYLELHRGTLTTQALVKQLNRSAEHRLLEAEAFAAIASLSGFDYSDETIDSTWKSVLLNQFHDVLPGSSIGEVYDDTHRMLGAAVASATEIRDTAVAHLTGPAGSKHVAIVNAALHPRPLVALLSGIDDKPQINDRQRASVVTQPVSGGLLVAGPEPVPPLGWTGLALGAGRTPDADDAGATRFDAVSVETQPDGNVLLENDEVRIRIGPDGTIASLFDRRLGRKMLTDRGNQMWAYVDKPYAWDAWDIDEAYPEDGEELTDVSETEIAEWGPIRGAVSVTRRWRHSTIRQTYRLWAGSARLDIETEMDWHERQMLLRASFPIAVHAHEATFETMYGVVRRPTHRNTSWDAAKFEVAGHRFADLSEPSGGVALLTDAKYGYSAHGNVIGLSLVRGPLYPDPLADEGTHRFTYALYSHVGGWSDGRVVDEAFDLNSPLLVAFVDEPVETTSLLQVSGAPLSLGSLKRAADGDGLIARVYEPHGSHGRSILAFSKSIASAERVTLLEDADATAEPIRVRDGSSLELDVRPFEVVSLRVRFD
jgi:alpha-mannosidase